LGWGTTGALLLALGLSLRERINRLAGLCILALAVGRLFLVEVWMFDPVFRILSFITLGATLIGLSFVYHRFSETLRSWL